MAWPAAAGLFFLMMIASAQSASPKVAFLNSSGQLVVASGDGITRWIVTNPGETLVNSLGFSWSPDGQRLFFAVAAGGNASLRIGDVASQQAFELGQVTNGGLSGGEWTADGRGVLIAANESVLLYPAGGGEAQTVAAGGNVVNLVSPFANAQPNLPEAHSLSPDGGFLFYWQAESANSGRYHVQALGGAALPLPGTNEPNARRSGLWADSQPLVAYWGYENGSSILSVTNAHSGETATLNSGRSVPIAPALWRPGTLQLLYRDGSEYVRIADLGCLTSGCPANPLESGLELLPGTASDIQIDPRAQWAFFRDGEQVKALALGCVSSGNCVGTEFIVGQNAVAQTWLHAAGNTLAYTAYLQDPLNANDRELRVVNLACLGNPGSCQAQSLLAQSIAGLASPDGQYVLVDQAGSGLNVLNIASLQVTNLSGPAGGPLGMTLLSAARWE